MLSLFVVALAAWTPILASAECKGWCASFDKKPWDIKCKWQKYCSTCLECNTGLHGALESGVCRTWCPTHENEWVDKCTWDSCAACTQCFETKTQSKTIEVKTTVLTTTTGSTSSPSSTKNAITTTAKKTTTSTKTTPSTTESGIQDTHHASTTVSIDSKVSLSVAPATSTIATPSTSTPSTNDAGTKLTSYISPTASTTKTVTIASTSAPKAPTTISTTVPTQPPVSSTIIITETLSTTAITVAKAALSVEAGIVSNRPKTRKWTMPMATSIIPTVSTTTAPKTTVTFTTVQSTHNTGIRWFWYQLGLNSDQQTVVVLSLVGVTSSVIVLATAISLTCVMRKVLRKRRKTKKQPKRTRRHEHPRRRSTDLVPVSSFSVGNSGRFPVNIDGSVYEDSTVVHIDGEIYADADSTSFSFTLNV